MYGRRVGVTRREGENGGLGRVWRVEQPLYPERTHRGHREGRERRAGPEAEDEGF
jgi:hypothetical protein